MASVFADARKAGRPSRSTASRVPLLALVGSKGGPDDGRPFPPLEPGLMPESGLHMAGEPAGPMAGELTAQARRGKNPLAMFRRQQRLAAGIRLGPHGNDPNGDRARAMGLLPGAPAQPGQLQFTNDGPDINVGRQLANIRWHGNPDGPVSVHDAEDETQTLFDTVNALRAASRRPQTYATRR